MAEDWLTTGPPSTKLPLNCQLSSERETGGLDGDDYGFCGKSAY